ncbi:MAG: CDP-alcohol phosphatidyltransferase family protein [bacterium]|nr:CDP-alcohol phosphatidyltransferase family protein [bacterium]
MGDPVHHTVDVDDPEALNRFWTIANAFSLLRVVLTPPVLWLIWLGLDYRWWMFGLVVVMILSDILDGYFARRFGEITRWGKILDPLADKVAIGTITLLLVFTRGLPVWVAVVVVGRDILILLATLILMNRVKIVISSNIWGRVATLVMSLLLIAYSMDFAGFKQPLLMLAAVLLVVSWFTYFLGFLRAMRGSEPA